MAAGSQAMAEALKARNLKAAPRSVVRVMKNNETGERIYYKTNE